MAKPAAPYEIWMTPTGATGCEGACEVGDQVAVLLVHGSDAGDDSLLLVALDASGRPIDGAARLEIANQTAYLAALASDGARALAAVVTRNEEDIPRSGATERRHHDRPRLLELGKPAKLRVRELGPWDVDVARMCAASVGGQATWTMGTVTWGPDGPTSQLAYAFGSGTSLPTLRRTAIAGSVIAHSADERGIVALAGTRTSLELWALPRSGDPRCLGEVARAKAPTTFSDARIVRLRDGFALAWYVSATASSGPVGGLWARTCSTTLDELTAPVHLARDDDATWDEWRAYDVGDGGLVLYGSGESGDPVQRLRWRKRDDVTSDTARGFPGHLPDALVATSKGAVVITCRTTNRGRRTRVLSRLVPI